MQEQIKAILMESAKIEMSHRENPRGQHVAVTSRAVKVSSDMIGFSIVVDLHRSGLENRDFAMLLFEFAVDEYLKRKK